MSTEKTNVASRCDAALVRRSDANESGKAHGKFVAECFDKDGKLKWRDTIENVVCTVGKNVALDAYLAGSGYTVVGPFMGLISSVDYSEILAADTMAAHAGWKEAGNTNAPTYAPTRKNCAWDAAASGSKALSAALSFGFTGSGTVKGCFLVYGTGAVNTIDSTAGTLYSAGLFTGGDKTVTNTDTLNVTYTASL